MTLSKLDLSEETNSASRLMLEKREKCIRKKLEVYTVYTSVHFHWCVYTLRLVGGVHTTLPYTTPQESCQLSPIQLHNFHKLYGPLA